MHSAGLRRTAGADFHKENGTRFPSERHLDGGWAYSRSPPLLNERLPLVPLSSIRLLNFRCFADSGEIPIRPLTVVFGRNNAGKSSILNSLFLLRQTVSPGPYYEEGLNMRGPLYPAGTYADIVHKHRSSENISMDFELRTSPEAVRGSSIYPEEFRLKPMSGRLTIEFCSAEPQPPRLVRFQAEAIGAPTLEIRRGRGRGGPYELHVDGKYVANQREAEFSSGFLPYIPRFGLKSKGRASEPFLNARQAALVLVREFRQTLSTLRAVGAFRAAPERRYEYQGRPPEAPDLTGAHVVHALIEDHMRRGKLRGSLLKSLNRWLKNVGRVRLMALRRISHTARLYEVRIKDVDSGRWANFADVGYGIGQALPVLVEGLRTPPGGLFIVQEPEIHLHPDAQLAIADFLIELSASNRTVIVETHSEAVLLRIRKAVAETHRGIGRGRRLQPDRVSIVHVQSNRDGASRVKALGVDELGQIRGWPKGFMDEVTDERFELLQTMTRKAMR